MRTRNFRSARQALSSTLTTASLAMLLLGPLCAPGALADSRASTTLSTTEVSELRSIAGSRPCAAMLMLYLRPTASASAQSGTFYFEGVPTPESVALLMDSTGSEALDSVAFVMQRSPYSTADYFVEVRWSIASLYGKSVVLTTQAQLVDKYSAPIEPRHPVEQSTSILLSNAGMVLLDKPSSL